jgi:hypothetical protein
MNMAQSKSAQVPEIVEPEEQKLALVAQERLEKALRAFSGGLPYQRERIIEMTQEACKRGLLAYYDMGRGLLLMQQHEDVQTLGHILEQNFPGMSRSAAYNYMLFAKTAAKLPNFKAFCEERGGWSKGLTMLTACTEEELAEFEAGGDLRGYKPDEIEMMSVRQLQKALRKADDDKIKAVETATHKLESEKAALEGEVADLKVQLEEADSPGDKALGLIKAAEKKLMEGLAFLQKIPLGVVEQEELVWHTLIGCLGLISRPLENLETRVLVAGRGHSAGGEGESDE